MSIRGAEFPAGRDVKGASGARGAASVAALVAVAVYFNTLGHGFVIDDIHQIVDNEWVTSFSHLREVFSQGVWDFEGRASSYYRPAMYVLYIATHAVAGKAPWAYHVVNIALHALATALVTLVAARLVGQTGTVVPRWLPVPLVAGLVFATHPVHTEAVAWVAGVTDLGVAVCGLLAVWLWTATGPRTWGRLAGSSAAFLGALLFKEPAVTMLPVLVAYDAIARRQDLAPRRLARNLAPHLGALAVYLALRVHALGGLVPTASATGLDLRTWTRSVVALAGRYAETLLVPSNLSVAHHFRPPASLLSPEGLVDTAWLVAAAGLVAAAAWRSRAARFAVVLLIAPLLPAFHLGALNQGLDAAFAERYLYVPSAGFAILAALAIAAVARRAPGSVVPATAALALVGAYGTGTVARNAAWKDALALWSDAARKTPDHAVARMNHGFALLAARRTAEGTAELQAAARLQPDLADREIRKGHAYLQKGLWKNAVLAFHAALALDPGRADAHFSLALAHEQRGNLAVAVQHLTQAVSLRPGYAEAHNNLGVLLADRGDLDKARRHFEEAVRQQPDDPDYRANLESARARGAPARP